MSARQISFAVVETVIQIEAIDLELLLISDFSGSVFNCYKISTFLRKQSYTLFSFGACVYVLFRLSV